MTVGSPYRAVRDFSSIRSFMVAARFFRFSVWYTRVEMEQVK